LNSQSTFPPDDDEDTIEVQLTPEEMRRLSRAVRQAYTSKGRYRLWSVSFAAALVGIGVGVAASIAWRSAPPRQVAQRIAPSATTRIVPPMAAPPAVLAKPPVPQVSHVSQVAPVAPVAPSPPVRVKNPFDPQEVFEFPAGTTRAEARRQVSELLLQRAVDRGSAKP
jgi:hypothetical protein